MGRQKGTCLSPKELANLAKSHRRQGIKQAPSQSVVSLRLPEEVVNQLLTYAEQYDCLWKGKPSLKRLFERIGSDKDLMIVSKVE